MKRSFIFLLGLLCIIMVEAKNHYFKHLGVSDGLSQVCIFSIYQDELGAVWSQDEATGEWIKDNENKLLIRYGMDISKEAVKKYNSAKNTAIEFYDKIGEDSYYNRIVVDRYPWSKAMLLYPVPYNEMQKSKLTVQNPLWN